MRYANGPISVRWNDDNTSCTIILPFISPDSSVVQAAFGGWSDVQLITMGNSVKVNFPTYFTAGQQRRLLNQLIAWIIQQSGLIVSPNVGDSRGNWTIQSAS